MEVNWFNLIFNSVSLGIGLAMDAFSVSLANGLKEPKMKLKKIFAIAGIFALFQALMPLIGWVAVAGFAELFDKFKPFIPWIAFILLCFIGAKMIFDTARPSKEENEAVKSITVGALLVQAVATSIDALSVGFTISEYNLPEATLCSALIGFVTFFICFAGIIIGKKAGMKLAGKATILGGIILIFIGLEIFITSWF